MGVNFLFIVGMQWIMELSLAEHFSGSVQIWLRIALVAGNNPIALGIHYDDFNCTASYRVVFFVLSFPAKKCSVECFICQSTTKVKSRYPVLSKLSVEPGICNVPTDATVGLASRSQTDAVARLGRWCCGFPS